EARRGGPPVRAWRFGRVSGEQRAAVRLCALEREAVSGSGHAAEMDDDVARRQDEPRLAGVRLADRAEEIERMALAVEKERAVRVGREGARPALVRDDPLAGAHVREADDELAVDLLDQCAVGKGRLVREVLLVTHDPDMNREPADLRADVERRVP